MYMHQLTLYYKPTCGFCAKVFQFMEQNSITVPMKNVLENSEFRNELLNSGGKTQIPCLVIDGRALYESDDIIKWLSKNWSSQ